MCFGEQQAVYSHKYISTLKCIFSEKWIIYYVTTESLANVIWSEHSWVVLSCIAVLFAGLGGGDPANFTPVAAVLETTL